MVEVASQGSVSYQDELWIGRKATGGTTFTQTQILGVETFAMPEKVPDSIDVSHQQSPGRSRESIAGLLAEVDFSTELQFWPEHASQIMLDQLATLTETGEAEEVQISFVVGGMQRTYRGKVWSWIPNAPVGEKRTATLTVKIYERITPNPELE